jgi:membrane protein involved in colicin uptake
VGAFGLEVARVEVDNLREKLEGLNVVVGGQSLPFFQVYNQVLADLQGVIEGDTEAQNENNAARREGVDLLGQQTDAIRELTKAQQRAKVEAREQVEAQRAFYEQLYQQGLERGQAAREQYEAEQRAAQEREEALNAIAERAAQERLAIQAEAADAAAQAARQSIFASVGGAMAGLIQAEGDAMTRVRKVLGQELVARGQAALAQAAIMAATLNPAAAGVAAAGLGAIALGKRFGAGGGGMGAGRGGGGGGRSATVTQNITFAGGAAGQDTRAIAAAIGRASRDGVLEGMA